MLTNQRDVLKALADKTVRLSVWHGKVQIVKRDVFNTPVHKVQNGLPTKMLDNELLAYDGGYELTEKGKRRAGI